MIRQIVRFTLAAALAGAGATVGSPRNHGRTANLPTAALPLRLRRYRNITDCFRDAQIPRGGRIAPGTDLGGWGHTALNITGSAGAGGATWLTVVDQAPGDVFQDNVYGSEFLCADILIQRFDNTKGAGVVTFFNQVDKEGNLVDKKGLALILYNAGNTDRLVLATVEGLPAKAGKVAVVKSLPLGGLIQENAWYRVLLTAIVGPVDDQDGRRTSAGRDSHGAGLHAREDGGSQQPEGSQQLHHSGGRYLVVCAGFAAAAPCRGRCAGPERESSDRPSVLW